MTPDAPQSLHEGSTLAPGALGQWWRQGARSAIFLRPDWRQLQTTPTVVAMLIVVATLVGLLIERLYIPGAASFYWPAIQVGWLPTAVTIWICWALVPRSRDPHSSQPPSPAALFSMLAAQVLPIEIVLGCIFVPLTRFGPSWTDKLGTTGTWAMWVAPVAWIALAQFKLIWQSGSPGRLVRGLAGAVLAGLLILGQVARPLSFWYPVPTASGTAVPEQLSLTQDLLELQPRILAEQLQTLRAERPGVTDIYAITYSPYADDEVFRRESAMVANVMEQRFDAAGHTVQLVNHRETAQQLPWATPKNLQRTIQKMAALMNPDEDILFIHLTSHGARDGVLSTQLWPLTLDALTPALLKQWLDEAKVRYRVISVSACFSGSWVAPLANDETLVMTAADAKHTSYGCGKGSQLTYFGRAMFDEQLRRTWSFEQAHAAARVAIEERERAAGKTGGYSNPQISVGERIRGQLAKLVAQRSAANQ